jgi:hypothetical protein
MFHFKELKYFAVSTYWCYWLSIKKYFKMKLNGTKCEVKKNQQINELIGGE